MCHTEEEGRGEWSELLVSGLPVTTYDGHLSINLGAMRRLSPRLSPMNLGVLDKGSPSLRPFRIVRDRLDIDTYSSPRDRTWAATATGPKQGRFHCRTATHSFASISRSEKIYATLKTWRVFCKISYHNKYLPGVSPNICRQPITKLFPGMIRYFSPNVPNLGRKCQICQIYPDRRRSTAPPGPSCSPTDWYQTGGRDGKVVSSP